MPGMRHRALATNFGSGVRGGATGTDAIYASVSLPIVKRCQPVTPISPLPLRPDRSQERSALTVDAEGTTRREIGNQHETSAADTKPSKASCTQVLVGDVDRLLRYDCGS